MQLDSIVMSKDRPAQLNLLLESIDRNGGDVVRLRNTAVQYAASDYIYRKSYQKLEELWPDVLFVAESVNSFKNSLWSTAATACQGEYLNFFTDDDILYRPITFGMYDVDDLFRTFNLSCLSLRLGANTYIQDQHRNQRTVFPNRTEVTKDFYVWHWRHVANGSNFSYPLSVDGHIFSRETILPLLEGPSYFNPNSLECVWQQEWLNTLGPIMGCPTKSNIVNSPNNRVQETCQNLAGVLHNYTAEELNLDFQRGLRLDLDRIFEGVDVVGAHQELELFYKTKLEASFE